MIKPMRYIYAIIMILVFSLFGSSAFAIERTRAADDSTRTRNTRPHYTPDKESMDRRSDSSRDRKDYDDFIDRNNNGIDDRAERNSEQQESDDAGKKDSESKQEKTDDSNNSRGNEKPPSQEK